MYTTPNSISVACYVIFCYNFASLICGQSFAYPCCLSLVEFPRRIDQQAQASGRSGVHLCKCFYCYEYVIIVHYKVTESLEQHYKPANLTDTYRTFYPTTATYTFFSREQEKIQSNPSQNHNVSPPIFSEMEKLILKFI